MPGAGVTGSCELPNKELNPGPLEEQQALLTTEHPHQLPDDIIYYIIVPADLGDHFFTYFEKMWKMRNKHRMTWNMLRNNKNVKNENAHCRNLNMAKHEK